MTITRVLSFRTFKEIKESPFVSSPSEMRKRRRTDLLCSVFIPVAQGSSITKYQDPDFETLNVWHRNVTSLESQLMQNLI